MPLRSVCILFISLCVSVANAQNDNAKLRRVAVFAPVYLDSVFTGDSYKLGKNNLPKYLLPGLDFYNGVMMAVDSLNADKATIDVLVYDSKSADAAATNLSYDADFNDVSLIIAAFNTRAEVRSLADLALKKNIPLISATYPNDGGTTANPYFAMVNPTITTHIEAIYRYLHRTYPTENILLFRRKGNMGNLVQYMLTDMNKKTAGTQLKIKPFELADNFTAADILSHLDSTRKNIVLCGALDESFGVNLSKVLADAKNYPTIVIGMPTWDGVREIGPGIDMVYSTPYNMTRTDKLSQQLSIKYRDKYAARPSDMFFKGFESMYHFSKLLVKYGDKLAAHLSDKDFKIFDDFDFQPVRSKKESATPDYLENKKIYFIHKVDGKVKSVN